MIYGDCFLPAVGGVQTAMRLLAEGLVKSDKKNGFIDVTVVTHTRANGMDDSIFPFRVVRQPGFWALVRLVRASDVVHIAGPCLIPLVLAWLLRVPAVIEHHGYQANCPNGLLFIEPSRVLCPGHFMRKEYGRCLRCCSSSMNWPAGMRTFLLLFVRRWLCKRVAANITISNHVATRLELPRCRTVYYGIEQVFLETNNNGLPLAETPEIGYVGRLVTEKGPHVLLHAARYLRDDDTRVKISFIGDGPERSHLEMLSGKLGLKEVIHFKGELQHAELARAVSQIGVVVMPSLCEETAGLAAIEQMMRGRVVIASDIGGLTEVVGEAGLKFPPGDARTLASCIQQVIASPSLAESLGSKARSRAMALFQQEAMIQGHLSLYEEILGPLNLRKRNRANKTC